MFATRSVRKRDAGRGGAARFAKDLRVTKVPLLALAASYTVLINYKEVFCGRNLDAFRSHVSVAKTIRAASPCDSNLENAVTSFTASGIWVKNFPDGEINSLTKLRLIAICLSPGPPRISFRM